MILNLVSVVSMQGGDSSSAKARKAVAYSADSPQSSMFASLLKALLPLLVVIAALLFAMHTQQKNS